MSILIKIDKQLHDCFVLYIEIWMHIFNVLLSYSQTPSNNRIFPWIEAEAGRKPNQDAASQSPMIPPHTHTHTFSFSYKQILSFPFPVCQLFIAPWWTHGKGSMLLAMGKDLLSLTFHYPAGENRKRVVRWNKKDKANSFG